MKEDSQMHFELASVLERSPVKWVSCHCGMACSQVADGGDVLQVWRVTVNTLNKQSQTTNKRWPPALGVGCRANNPSSKTSNLL
jgi:hypothetical protein